MKPILTHLILISTILPLTAQTRISELDSVATKLARELVENELTQSAIVYVSGCTGCYSLDNCQCAGGLADVYVIWNESEPKVKKINCCSTFHGKGFDDTGLLTELRENPGPVFSSIFQFDYIQTHSDFDRLKLITKDSIHRINLESELFNEDCKYQTLNMEQPAKIFIDKLKGTLKVANESEWTIEY